MSRGVAPGPRGRRLLGSLLEVRRDPLCFVRRTTREYGDVVRFRMGRRELFLLNHPDHFRHVLHDNPGNYAKGLGLSQARPLFGNGLLTNDGELWSTQRQRLQQAFQSDRTESYAESMVDAAEAMLGRWAARPGEPLDLSQEMARLTLDVLERTLLCVDLGRVADRLIARFDVVSRWAMRRMTALVEVPLNIPTPGNRRARKALLQLEEMVQEMIAARRRGARKIGDALEILLDAHPPIDEKLLRDEILTLLVAGHETSAAALTWTWYLLARHPGVRQRLCDELAAVLGGHRPTLADSPRLVTTRTVIEEALRLYPPVWMMPRRAIDRDEIAGYVIPAGSEVLLSVYSMHRHSAFWEAPDEFRPERFAPEPGGGRPAHTYLPFGSGPRACLGRFFGKLEILLVVAAVAPRVRLDLASEARVEAEPLLTLRPRHGLSVNVSRVAP